MILYHYTTAMGLKGILESKSLWATDYRFLNDSSEFRIGWDKIIFELNRREFEIKSVSAKAWEILKSSLNQTQNPSIYGMVASLTTQGDLLSQWRGYNNGKGYAVGFDYDWVDKNAANQDFSLERVVYDLDVQNRSVYETIELLIDLLEQPNDNDKSILDLIKEWQSHALKVALTIKDKHFEEENEYRLINIRQFWPTNIQLRTTPMGLVPYLPCHFDAVRINNPIYTPQNLGLESIIVGPALKDQQITAVEALLSAQGMRFKICKSEIPYVAD